MEVGELRALAVGRWPLAVGCWLLARIGVQANNSKVDNTPPHAMISKKKTYTRFQHQEKAGNRSNSRKIIRYIV